MNRINLVNSNLLYRFLVFSWEKYRISPDLFFKQITGIIRQSIMATKNNRKTAAGRLEL